MRIGPRDPVTHTAKVGLKNEVVKPDHTLGSLQPRVMKVFKLKPLFKLIGENWLFRWFQDPRRIQKK
jgi:hypothetical protein